MTKVGAKKRKKGKGERVDAVVRRRAAVADEMARSATITVTLRIPSAFNDWLDEYRHLSYPERVGKQDLVVEALTLGYLCRGKAGERRLAPEAVLRHESLRSQK